MNTRTKLLLKYCKDSKSKRGLEYISQIDIDNIKIENVTISFATWLYVHTQFKSLHLRKVLCCSGQKVYSTYG